MVFKDFKDFVNYLEINGTGFCLNIPEKINTEIFTEDNMRLIHPRAKEMSLLGGFPIQVCVSKIDRDKVPIWMWASEVDCEIRRTSHTKIIKIMPCNLVYSEKGNLLAVKGNLVA